VKKATKQTGCPSILFHCFFAGTHIEQAHQLLPHAHGDTERRGAVRIAGNMQGWTSEDRVQRLSFQVQSF